MMNLGIGLFNKMLCVMRGFLEKPGYFKSLTPACFTDLAEILFLELWDKVLENTNPVELIKTKTGSVEIVLPRFETLPLNVCIRW